MAAVGISLTLQGRQVNYKRVVIACSVWLFTVWLQGYSGRSVSYGKQVSEFYTNCSWLLSINVAAGGDHAAVGIILNVLWVEPRRTGALYKHTE